MTELYVVFRVGTASYALPASAVVQLESFTGATPVPGTDQHVEGLVQVRGTVVPVINLRVRFGLPRVDPTLDTRVIIVQRAERLVAILADSAREVVKLEPSSFQPPPEVVARQSRGFVRSVANLPDRLLMIIDCDRVIGTEDLHDQSVAQQS